MNPTACDCPQCMANARIRELVDEGMTATRERAEEIAAEIERLCDEISGRVK